MGIDRAAQARGLGQSLWYDNISRGLLKSGAIQKLTPSCDALYVPDIDASLDDEAAKRAFWKAFRSNAPSNVLVLPQLQLTRMSRSPAVAPAASM